MDPTKRGRNDSMKVKSQAKFIRISPRKVRLVLPLIRNKNAHEALSILEGANKKAARLLIRVVSSGIANAKVKKMNVDNLVIESVKADGGPTLKRIMPRAMGRAYRIFKRTTHITMELSDEVPSEKTETVATRR